MKTLHLMAPAALLALALGAQAQTPAPGQSGATLMRNETTLDRNTQRVELITHEDAGNRVEEVRAGGQTQRITVQPKSSMPAYEVLPPDPTQREAAPGGTGPRVWKIPF